MVLNVAALGESWMPTVMMHCLNILTLAGNWSGTKLLHLYKEDSFIIIKQSLTKNLLCVGHCESR